MLYRPSTPFSYKSILWSREDKELIAEGGVSFTSFDKILEQQPPILEWVNYGNIDDWFNLRIHLQLNQIKLKECRSDLGHVYSLWVEQTGIKATRKRLLDTLIAMEKTDTAEKY